MSGVGSPFDPLEKEGHGEGALFLYSLGDGREGDPGVARHPDVVVSGDRYIRRP
jgi:hypothetical protein